jgi:hypothetical protein
MRRCTNFLPIVWSGVATNLKQAQCARIGLTDLRLAPFLSLNLLKFLLVPQDGCGPAVEKCLFYKDFLGGFAAMWERFVGADYSLSPALFGRHHA